MLKDMIISKVEKALKNEELANGMICLSFNVVDINKEELENLDNLDLDNHYAWQILGDKLEVTYLRDLIGKWNN